MSFDYLNSPEIEVAMDAYREYAKADYRETSGHVVRLARQRWPHLVIAGASLPAREAQSELDVGLLDMVTYGRLLIANPDLVERLRDRRALIGYDPRMLETLE